MDSAAQATWEQTVKGTIASKSINYIVSAWYSTVKAIKRIKV